MILILRHQQGSPFTNVLCRNGVINSLQLADAINNVLKPSTLITNLYTCLPLLPGKHIRPLQTASIIGTKLNLGVNIITNDNLPFDKYKNKIIIWHDNDIQTLLNKYIPNNPPIIKWDDDDYSSCIIINNKKYYVVNNFVDKNVSFFNKLYYRFLKRFQNLLCSFKN